MSVRSCATWAVRFATSLGMLLVAAPLLAEDLEPRPGDNGPVIEEELAQETFLDVVNRPLLDVLGALGQKHQISLVIDSVALTDAGVGADTTVTFRARDRSLRSALEVLLSQLDLAYAPHENGLLITTRTEAENLLTTKAYPVDDLLAPRDDGLAVRVIRHSSDLTDLIEVHGRIHHLLRLIGLAASSVERTGDGKK
ncbi:MAG TPA: hypothetical protein VGX78_19075 [Pirellulales bacterium]|nr:hypothetical protein [Pirellulales bacterium]